MEQISVNTLPNRERCYSNLKSENICNSDYEHAWEVWNTFDMKISGAYNDLDIQSSTLLLTGTLKKVEKGIGGEISHWVLR